MTSRPVVTRSVPAAFERVPFASGSYSTAHSDATSPAVCHVVTRVDPARLFTLGNALAAIGNAASTSDVSIWITPRAPPKVVVRQTRGTVLDNVAAFPFLDAGSADPLWALRALAFDVLQRLAREHTRGRYHGDVKPGNIVMLPDATFMLIDGGSWSDSRVTPRVRYVPTYVTTRSFRAPFMVEGPDNAGVNAAAGDVWALGATLLVLLAGGMFTAAPSGETVRQAAFLRDLLALRRPRSERIERLELLVPWLQFSESGLPDLLASMLGDTDATTCTAAAALRHPFFAPLAGAEMARFISHSPLAAPPASFDASPATSPECVGPPAAKRLRLAVNPACADV
jgi:Protein kinase domain